MLVTSTLLFLGLALWTAVDGARLILRRRALTTTQRLAMRQRREFLLGFALVLMVIYAVYLIASHR